MSKQSSTMLSAQGWEGAICSEALSLAAVQNCQPVLHQR